MICVRESSLRTWLAERETLPISAPRDKWLRTVPRRLISPQSVVVVSVSPRSGCPALDPGRFCSPEGADIRPRLIKSKQPQTICC